MNQQETCYAIKVLPFILLILVLGCISEPKSNITTLNLSNQKLTAIPDSVFLLTQLESLELGNNFIIYPPLSALGYDSLGDSLNKILEIPKDIAKLSQLRTLGLCFNDLQSLPKEIVKLEKLDTLNISYNMHMNIAEELEILKKMQWLKYLNIVGTNVDQSSIEELRKALPQTKIDAKLEDMLEEPFVF